MASSPQAPSTTSKVLQFLEDTQISDDMADVPSAAAEPGQASSPEPAQGLDNNNNKYKNMLRYKPNAGFQDEVSSFNGLSVPNTFKHKSHPNARTKPHIGTSFHETSEEFRDGTAERDHSDLGKDHSDLGKDRLDLGKDRSDLGQDGRHRSTGKTAAARESGGDFEDLERAFAPGNVLDGVQSPTKGNPAQTSARNAARSTNSAKSDPRSLDEEHTPNWMPSVLETPWDEAYTGGSSLKGKDLQLNFLNSSSNTFVHNNVQDGRPTTPMWRRAQDGYQSKISSEPPLRNIFRSYFDESSQDRDRSGSVRLGRSDSIRAGNDSIRAGNDSIRAGNNSHRVANNSVNRSRSGSGKIHSKGISGFSSTSTFSTPVATQSEHHLTESQIVQLENMLEQVKDQPDDYPVNGSPLKLFGNAYDTFTKSVLNQFVEKVRSNANSVQRNPKAPSSLPKFELRISDFTKSKDYTDKDFMKNADNLFAHLQKKGPAGDNLFQKSSGDSLHHPSLLGNNQNTATSTPKPNKVRSFTSSSSSTQITMDSELNLDRRPPITAAFDYDSLDDYTTEDKTSFAHRNSSNAEEYNSYTLDKNSDLNSYTSESSEEESEMNRENVSKETDDTDAVPFFGNSMSSVRKYPREEDVRNKNDKSNLDRSDFIRWKRPSQLRLSSANNIRRSSVVKGLVKPGQFPDQYGNMVLDPRENKWVSNDKENTFRGSLDSIEDLVTSLDPQENGGRPENLDKDLSILKRPQHRKKPDQNLEVSFQLPESSFATSNRSQTFDVTAVSALSNNTFSQSNKDIVSLITGSTDEAVWERIETINLSGKNITHLESLESYLPSLQSVDLSRNKLAFIDGIPTSVSELNVSENLLDSRASFRKLHDLQILDASFNRLVNLSGIGNSYNLTQLNLSGNMIEDIELLRPLRSLTSLNLSRNKIHGKLDFGRYNFANLQELNVAENLISSVQGLENVPNLRILNANENKLVWVSCKTRHAKLKKLCLKFNALQSVDVREYPFLRVLRIDGNRILTIHGLNKLHHLQEFSAKCQTNPEVVKTMVKSAHDVISMDLSGVPSLGGVFKELNSLSFFNLNVLNLSAVGLSALPSHFGEMLPNVRELNLNFNKFDNLGGLAPLTRLRKLYLLSNNMSSMENLITSLQKSRKTLAVLDLRLNALNFRFYPYVFSPDELEHRVDGKDEVSESPIPIHALDDIENFSIHYKAVTRSKEDWQDRDREFFSNLVQEGKQQHVQDRISYESLLLEFFNNLKELDGTRVLVKQRVQMRSSRDVQERN